MQKVNTSKDKTSKVLTNTIVMIRLRQIRTFKVISKKLPEDMNAVILNELKYRS